jgi:hypothetical protein
MWDKSQLVGLGIPLRFIAKPSYSGHCASTHVSGNSQKPWPNSRPVRNNEQTGKLKTN